MSAPNDYWQTRAEELEQERDKAVEALESLEAAIIESLPYRYDDGTGDEADPGECIEYAAEELAKLRKDVSRLQKMLDVCSSVHEHNVKLVSERDELRAEVERLQSWTPIGTYSLDVQHEEERRRLTMERDKARGEAEVLNKLLRQHRTASVGTVDRLEETEAELREEIRRLNNEVFALRREGLRLATDLERAEARIK